MEMDEFEQWQNDKTSKPLALAVADLPDIPDVSPPIESQDTADLPLSDADGCLAMIQQRRNDCESAEEVEALKADVAELIARLSPADQAKASAILNDEG
jgi:hypothetical protein